ncbi:unnamed protein product [Oppiella nova]|uniref:Ig-like domain-containing protein n=1 Tax=Oppiella nova TaxID=334625 RepID=A0A7R9QE63_9ACAR|nr:unnamed protein product [Oppiella nova]CAG2163527.1 unnamed protein product [Oppiella nova]
MCQAVNNNITTPSSTSITLDMNLKPTEVRITQLTPILVAQQEALFECNSFGSRPMPTIHWFFDGKRHDTRSHGEQQTSTTLTITVDREHRGSILECVAQNPKIPNSDSPQLHLKLGTPTMSLDNVQEGIDIYFDCHIDANPRPTTPIVWLFNGNALHTRQGIIESNQSLVLQHVNRWQSGTYQCQSSNQMGTALSNAINLRIRYAPVCSQPYTLVYGLSLHESIAIECEVDANPPQVSFQWKYESYTNLATFSQINDSSSILSYTPHANQEFGQIECIAKNSIGIQRQSCKYLITQTSEPYFPYQCQVINQSDSTLTVNCVQINRTVIAAGALSPNSTQYPSLTATTTAPVAHSNPHQQRSHNKLHINNNSKYSSSKSHQTSTTSPYLIVHPNTYYVCEVYDSRNGRFLYRNVSVDAIRHRLMRQNASFDFFIDELPPKTQLKLRIYAVNARNVRSATELELKTQTLIPAQRLIDFEGTGESADMSANNTLSKGSVRIHGKHLIIGVLISAAVVAVIVVIMAIIAVFKVRYSSSSIHLAAIDVMTGDDSQDREGDGHNVETMLGTDCTDECSSDQTLLKCGTTSSDGMDQFKCDEDMGYHHKSNGNVGPPDIIPVPYFTTTTLSGGGAGSTTCCDNELNCHECNDHKSTCSRNCFLDGTDASNYFTDEYYKMQDMYPTKGGRVYVYNKEDHNNIIHSNKAVANQLTDYQNVLHVNLLPGNSKQQPHSPQQQVANVSL